MALDCTTDDTGSPGGHVVTSLRVDGGMTSNAMLMQFQADLVCNGCTQIKRSLTNRNSIAVKIASWPSA